MRHFRAIIYSKRIVIIVAAFGFLSWGTACGNQQQTQNQNVKSYDDDGYLGVSDSNPNMQTSPSHHTYYEDTKLMEATLGKIRGIRDSTVYINGTTVSINLKMENGYTDEEEAQIKFRAIKELRYMMPRYNIRFVNE